MARVETRDQMAGTRPITALLQRTRLFGSTRFRWSEDVFGQVRAVWTRTSTRAMMRSECKHSLSKKRKEKTLCYNTGREVWALLAKTHYAPRSLALERCALSFGTLRSQRKGTPHAIVIKTMNIWH